MTKEGKNFLLLLIIDRNKSNINQKYNIFINIDLNNFRLTAKWQEFLKIYNPNWPNFSYLLLIMKPLMRNKNVFPINNFGRLSFQQRTVSYFRFSEALRKF